MSVDVAHARSRFMRSVHLERDHLSPRALDGYLLTSGARRVLRRLAPANGAPQPARAWTITGPYGTGKSAFALFAAKVFAPDSFPGTREARTLLRSGDAELARAVERGKLHGLWPVPITGAREPIATAVLRGLNGTIERLKRSHLQSIQRDVAKLLRKARDGHTLADREVVGVVQDLVGELPRTPGGTPGLLLVIDEFGKLLEYAASHPNRSDVFLLQSLAEFAARAERPFLLMTILHKDFSGYFQGLSAHERAEWEKVRGRFEDIVFEEPAEEMLRLLAQARSSEGTTAGGGDAAFRQLCDRALELSICPPGMPKAEAVTLLRRCWPLHPVVSLMLGQVFRKLAQNERSVFSFLHSGEPFSLSDHMWRTGGRDIYTTDAFYDYLIRAIGDGLFMQRNGKRWAEAEEILHRAADASGNEVAAIKTLGLFGATGSSGKLAPTAEVLELALAPALSSKESASCLRGLLGKSVAVMRRYNGSYSLWEGSDLDVDARITNARDTLSRSTTIASLAAQHIRARALVARRHFLERGTLRYFVVKFVGAADLPGAMKEHTDSDGQVLIVLADTPSEHQDARRLATSADAEGAPLTLTALPHGSREIASLLRELAAVEWVSKHTPELAGDATARREVTARLADLRRRVDTAIEHLLYPSGATVSGCLWYHKGERRDLASRRQVNEYLSVIVDRVFSATPVLRNELVNRRELSSAAAAARRTLIEAMIARPAVENLGIDGTPPEKSIYLSVLSRTGLHQMRDGVLGFGPPAEDGDKRIRRVWEAIEEYFDSSSKSLTSVSDLFQRLQSRPFGIRAGIAPIIISAALIASDSDVALYEDGTFVPTLTAPIVERLIKTPERFTVRRWIIRGVRAQVYEQLAEMLGKKSILPFAGKRNVLDVVRPLLRFASQLPEYTASTDSLTPQAKAVRAALLTAREADQLLFVQLPAACGFGPIAEDRQSSDELQKFLGQLRRSLGELQRCYDQLLSELTEAVGSAFGAGKDAKAIRSALQQRAANVQQWAVDPALRDLVTRFVEPGLDDRQWIESITSLLVERTPSRWRDADRSRFAVSLAKAARLFNSLESLVSATQTNHHGIDAIRIEIGTRQSPAASRLVHIPVQERALVERLSSEIGESIGRLSTGMSEEVMLAAVAKAIEKRLAVR